MAMSEDAGGPGLPRELFDDILPRIHDLAELKVVLVVMDLAQRRGSPGVWLSELLEPGSVRTIVESGSPEPAEDRLRRSLDRATANGFLFRVVVGDPASACYLPATGRNASLLERLRGGEAEATEALGIPEPAPVAVYRPNVYAVYERHIGPLTPLVAEQLRGAERAYPRAWIEEAMRQAVQYNRRNWRYVESILQRWEDTGAPHGMPGRGG